MTRRCFSSLVQTVGRILHLGVRASHTKRPLPHPATLCRPQPGPTHQRAQQPALPRSTTHTARNLVSQPSFRAISSTPSQTAADAPAAAVVQCARSQSQALEIRAVTSKQGMVPPEAAAAAAAASMAAARPSPALAPLVSNSTKKLFLRLELLLLLRLMLSSTLTPSLKY